MGGFVWAIDLKLFVQGHWTATPTARSDERMSLQTAIAERSSLRGVIGERTSLRGATATWQSSGLNNTLQQQGKSCEANNPRFISWRTNAMGQSTPVLRVI